MKVYYGPTLFIWLCASSNYMQLFTTMESEHHKQQKLNHCQAKKQGKLKATSIFVSSTPSCAFTGKTYQHIYMDFVFATYINIMSISVCSIYKYLNSSEALFHHKVVITHFIIFFRVWKWTPEHNLVSCNNQTNTRLASNVCLL